LLAHLAGNATPQLSLRWGKHPPTYTHLFHCYCHCSYRCWCGCDWVAGKAWALRSLLWVPLRRKQQYSCLQSSSPPKPKQQLLQPTRAGQPSMGPRHPAPHLPHRHSHSLTLATRALQHPLSPSHPRPPNHPLPWAPRSCTRCWTTAARWPSLPMMTTSSRDWACHPSTGALGTWTAS